MQTYNPKQYVELFHLLFLDQLGRKLDKKLYALKGGCNLRFYFNSIRYSEDIDIDTHIIAKETLTNKVRTILNSVPFNSILQAKKIEIAEMSEPKQTNTTLHWKVSLNIPNSTFPVNTKIEFSRRGLESDILFEAINSTLLREYMLPPIMVNHYSSSKMYEQKIQALIFRNQTQARDIFDLYHLIGLGTETKIKNKKILEHLDEAQSNALSLSFDDFKGQVLAYLPEDYRAQYDSKAVWENMVLAVINAMEK
jgi:predicted nucleotidyltransferase component of viral defense system